MNSQLEEKINEMSYEELVSFKGIAVFLDVLVNLLGMGTVLFVLNVPNVFTIILGLFLVYLLSNFSVAMVQTKKYVTGRIEKLRR